MASTTSALSRHRPIVLTVAGAAAAYSAYLLWAAFAHPPQSTLHRSNAVHRRRNPRRRTRSNRNDDPNADAQADATESVHLGPPYGVFVVEDAENHGHRHRFPLFPGRLPDVDWFRRVCHHEDWMAEELAEEAQRQFLDNYLEREVDPTTHLSPSHETSRIYRRLIHWGLPRAQIVAAFVRHNRRNIGAPQTDGTQDLAIPANDDETEAASWHEAESQAGGMAVNDQNGDGHALRRTLYYIAEDQARQKGIVHRGITCDGCSTTPIRGIRWRCTNCIDYDLCSDCEATNIHPKTHMFQKVKVPARYLGYTRNPMPVYFPGNPGYMPSIVPNAVRKSLEEQTQYEPEEIDGLWEQFTCLANVQWDEDPEKLGAAIDRRAFDKSFVPRYTANIPAPNLVYDRVFAFFDSNGDGLIGFKEFVLGMNFIRMSPHSRSKLRKIFECYDIDGDNYVTRKDFLRIFRAYYNILREKTRDMLMVAEEHLSVAGAMDTIESSQPLSSAFLGGPNFNRPRSNVRQKTLDRFGDPHPEDGVVRENGHDVEERAQLIADSGTFRLTNSRGSIVDDSQQSVEQVRQEAVGDRWRRREFYIDEEEGFTAPDSQELPSTDAPPDVTSTVEGQSDIPNGIFTRPTHSRSSSRVRFADDLESDARSDISTSSRPVGERWGGYEIPQAEEDLGKDILYQVTQQGCNEMLDPIFKRKEDLAMEVQATKTERQMWRQKINEFVKDMEEKTGADFKNDPLVRSPEAEELMKVSLQFVSLVTGRSWKTYQTLKNKGTIPDEDIDALDGFVEEVFQPFERDLRQAENNGISNEAYKNFITSARSLIAKAAKRISETKNDPGATTDIQKREARLEVDLVDMQLDELFERSNLLTDGERDNTERTRRSEEPEREVNGETNSAPERETSQDRELRWLEHLMRGRPSSPPPDSRILEARREQVRSRNQRTDSPPRDPTMPQFRPNSLPAQENFLPMPNPNLPTNTTAPPERPSAPEIIPPAPPVEQTPSVPHRDPTLPQFRPNSERDIHPPRTSSLIPPPAPIQETTPSISRQPSPAPAPSHANEPTLFIPVSSETSASDSSSDDTPSSGESTSAEEDEDDDDNTDADVSMRPSDLRDLPEEFLSLVSTAIREQRVRDAINSSSAAARAPNAYLTAAYARQRDHRDAPDERRLARLAMLEGAESEIRKLGRGRISFEEFAEIMQGSGGGALVFVEGWLELGSL